MRTKGLFSVAAFFAFVLLSYGSVSAQEADKPKTDTAASNPRVVVTDSIADAAKAKEAATAPKPAPTTTKSFGNHAVTVTEGVVGQTIQKGKWYTVTTWDGTKWVSKRTFFPDKDQ